MVLGWLSHDGGLPLPLAMLVALAVGAAPASSTASVITYARLPPFIATLAMMSIARGLANLITDGQQIVGYPDSFYELSSNRLFRLSSASPPPC